MVILAVAMVALLGRHAFGVSGQTPTAHARVSSRRSKHLADPKPTSFEVVAVPNAGAPDVTEGLLAFWFEWPWRSMAAYDVCSC
jgi:hypothetical protein